jgi:hypothetical protein
MAKPQQKQLMLYANLMEEVKVRFDCINHAAQGFTGLPAPVVRELLYQQIRFLCELIALSCLVAHGDIAALQSHKIGRSYSADEILDRMSKLRPHFYPIAVRETSVDILDGNRQNHNLQGVNPSPLPKEDLITLYGKTHKHLHRGSLKRLLSSSTPLDMTINMPEIIAHVQKISDLLAHHIIALSEHELIICLLLNPKDNNRVQIATAERGELSLQTNSPASGS